MLMLVSDSDMIARTSDMETLFEEYAKDTNGDGKVCVSIYNIPITEDMDIDDDLQLSYRVKLMSELQLPNDLIIIADSGSDETIKPEKTFFGQQPCERLRLLPERHGYCRKTGT